MKLLIISNSEWDDSNSFGNTFSNIFGNIDNVEIANIYCRPGVPDTKSCNRFFQISEKLLLQNLFDSRKPSGRVVFNREPSDSGKTNDLSGREQSLLGFARRKRWLIFFWLRDLVWAVGRWESEELYDFVESFGPQLIVLPVYQLNYINKMALRIRKKYGIPMVAYISDDEYTLKQFSLSPFYWIDRLLKRRWVKKAIDHCDILYVISEVQKRDYDLIFKKDCRILMKGGDFGGEAPVKKEVSHPVQLLYAGNTGDGRLNVLLMIGEALERINSRDQKAVLNIYTRTPLSKNDIRKLKLKKSLVFHGAVAYDKIQEVQNNADILVHVESFKLKERLRARHSFSTKLVDYFQAARCIFAVGWERAASMDYLIKNDIAVVVTEMSELENKLGSIISDPSRIKSLGEKSWDFGQKHHQLAEIQSGLVSDFDRLIYDSEARNNTNNIAE